MRKKISLLPILFVLSCVVAFGQNASPVSLSDFAGNWKADLKKSFSSSDKKEIIDYTARITKSDGTLNVHSSFVIKDITSNIFEVFIIDRKEHSIARTEASTKGGRSYYVGSYEARAYTASIKGSRIKIVFHSKFTNREFSYYLDQCTFDLDSEKKTLTIETIIRSTRPGDAANSKITRVVLARQN